MPPHWQPVRNLERGWRYSDEFCPLLISVKTNTPKNERTRSRAPWPGGDFFHTEDVQPSPLHSEAPVILRGRTASDSLETGAPPVL